VNANTDEMLRFLAEVPDARIPNISAPGATSDANANKAALFFLGFYRQ